jgi:hypothetical protein
MKISPIHSAPENLFHGLHYVVNASYVYRAAILQTKAQRVSGEVPGHPVFYFIFETAQVLNKLCPH